MKSANEPIRTLASLRDVRDHHDAALGVEAEGFPAHVGAEDDQALELLEVRVGAVCL
jgi:hypothetical protein